MFVKSLGFFCVASRLPITFQNGWIGVFLVPKRLNFLDGVVLSEGFLVILC